MSDRSSIVIPRKTTHLAKRLAQPFSKRKLLHAARVIVPTLVALTFAAVANVAHAQGMMDFSGAQTLMGSFKTILRILERAGGYRPTLYLNIENPPYMALVIEATPEPGPLGLPGLSVAHYGIQNGDAMRDPEMCFELSKPVLSRHGHANGYGSEARQADFEGRDCLLGSFRWCLGRFGNQNHLPRPKPRLHP